MKRRTLVYVVCSARPQVGKTFLARLLVDFFLLDARPVEAFDLSAEEPSLVDFVPDVTKVASIKDVFGQMALFDALVVDDRRAKIVDLSHHDLEAFFTVVRETGFVEEAQRRDIEFVALFVGDLDRASARAYAQLAQRVPGLSIVPVHNERNAKAPALHELFPPLQAGALPLHLSLLAPLHHKYIASPPFSFAARAGLPPLRIPSDVYSELERWLRRTFVGFRELELRMLLASVKSSLHDL